MLWMRSCINLLKLNKMFASLSALFRLVLLLLYLDLWFLLALFEQQNKLFICEPGVCTSLNKIVHFQAPIYFDKLRHIFLSSFFYCWMCRLWEIPPAHINQIFGTSERRHIPWMSGFLVWYFFSLSFPMDSQ